MRVLQKSSLCVNFGKSSCIYCLYQCLQPVVATQLVSTVSRVTCLKVRRIWTPAHFATKAGEALLNSLITNGFNHYLNLSSQKTQRNLRMQKKSNLLKTKVNKYLKSRLKCCMILIKLLVLKIQKRMMKAKINCLNKLQMKQTFTL